MVPGKKGMHTRIKTASLLYIYAMTFPDYDDNNDKRDCEIFTLLECLEPYTLTRFGRPLCASIKAKKAQGLKKVAFPFEEKLVNKFQVVIYGPGS